MSTFKGLYDIRDVTAEDTNFILATFLRGVYYGYKEADTFFSLIPKDIFMDNYKKVAEALVRGNRTTIKVACLREDPSVILGYSILSNDFQTIHWVYVKNAWRNRGIARTLTPLHPTAVTHLTKTGKSLLTKFQNVVFDPFRL